MNLTKWSAARVAGLCLAASLLGGCAVEVAGSTIHPTEAVQFLSANAVDAVFLVREECEAHLSSASRQRAADFAADDT